MRCLINTLEELRKNALAELGVMADGSHDTFMVRATEVASQRGVANPRLIVGIIYTDAASKQAGAKEFPYPIKQHEWDEAVSRTEAYLESSPRVYVIDSDWFDVAF